VVLTDHQLYKSNYNFFATSLCINVLTQFRSEKKHFIEDDFHGMNGIGVTAAAGSKPMQKYL
jgi:hypothetical protein